MAHCCRTDPDMEQTQRDLSELRINENQGKLILIKQPPNHSNYPAYNDSQPNM
jgi:hypothetical protein